MKVRFKGKKFRTTIVHMSHIQWTSTVAYKPHGSQADRVDKIHASAGFSPGGDNCKNQSYSRNCKKFLSSQ